MMLTEETEALNIDHLMRDGSIAIGNIKVELAQRASERLIISFFQSDYKTGWLNDVCIEEDFSELRLTAQTSDAFETPEVLAMLGDLAKDQRFAGTKITLCAAGEVCRFAVAATQKFKDPVTVFFDPSDSFATDTALVFFDPFTASANATAQLGQWLKCFASNGDSAATWSVCTCIAQYCPQLCKVNLTQRITMRSSANAETTVFTALASRMR